jgi:hypothetical protein
MISERCAASWSAWPLHNQEGPVLELEGDGPDLTSAVVAQGKLTLAGYTRRTWIHSETNGTTEFDANPP